MWCAICIDFHGGLLFVTGRACCSPSSNEFVSGLVRNPVVIGAKVEEQLRLVVARILCLRNTPQFVIPGICCYGSHLMAGKISD